jgi:very-short-patch-repair endonuclease
VLEADNIRVIRFWNHDVMENIDIVIQGIAEACDVAVSKRLP